MMAPLEEKVLPIMTPTCPQPDFWEFHVCDVWQATLVIGKLWGYHITPICIQPQHEGCFTAL